MMHFTSTRYCKPSLHCTTPSLFLSLSHFLWCQKKAQTAARVDKGLKSRFSHVRQLILEEQIQAKKKQKHRYGEFPAAVGRCLNTSKSVHFVCGDVEAVHSYYLFPNLFTFVFILMLVNLRKSVTDCSSEAAIREFKHDVYDKQQKLTFLPSGFRR